MASGFGDAERAVEARDRSRQLQDLREERRKHEQQEEEDFTRPVHRYSPYFFPTVKDQQGAVDRLSLCPQKRFLVYKDRSGVYVVGVAKGINPLNEDERLFDWYDLHESGHGGYWYKPEHRLFPFIDDFITYLIQRGIAVTGLNYEDCLNLATQLYNQEEMKHLRRCSDEEFKRHAPRLLAHAMKTLPDITEWMAGAVVAEFHDRCQREQLRRRREDTKSERIDWALRVMAAERRPPQ